MFPSFAALKSRKTVFLLLLIALTIVGYSTVYRAALGDKSRTDLTVYLRAAEAIENGENIYAVENERHWHYVYLPLLAILLVPFTSLPLWLNALLWYALSIAVLYAAYLGLKTLFSGYSGQNAWVLPACFILALPPLLNTLARGQLGALALFLALLPFVLNQNGKRFTAGFILGFAIVLKMSPLLILPFFFLMQRNWRALLGCACGGFVFGVLLPGFVFGPGLFIRYLQIYYEAISAGTAVNAHQSYLWGELFTPFAGDNQSFYAVLTRLFWKTEAAFAGQANTLIKSVNFGLLLSLLGLCAWRFGIKQSDRDNKIKNDFVVFSLLSCIMLFTSPVSQLHHFTPLVLLGASAFLEYENHPSQRKILWTALSACLFLFTLGMIFDFFAVLGFPLWGTLGLWFFVLFSPLKK